MTSASVNIVEQLRLRAADGRYGLVQLGPERLPQHCRLMTAFDAAIASLGETGPLWRLSDPDPRPAPARLVRRCTCGRPMVSGAF